MKNTNLPISQLPLATALDGMETIPFAKSNANGGLLVSLLADYIRQGFATSTEVTELSGLLTNLTTLVNSIKEKIDTIPDMPAADGKCYALINGEWTAIAEATENVAVTNADLPEPTE